MDSNELDRLPSVVEHLKLLPIAQRYNAQRKKHHVLRTCCSPDLSKLRQIIPIPGDFGRGCVMCTVIRYCYLHFAPETPGYYVLAGGCLQSSCIALDFGHIVRGSENTDMCWQPLTIRVSFSARLNNDLTFRSWGHVSPDPRSPDTITKVQSWLKDCVETHQECGLEKSNLSLKAEDFRPSRLIRLDDNRDDIVRLASPSMPVAFAALSYCWGNVEQTVTLSSNVSSRYEQLSVVDLPQTHQDAVFFTRALGLKYLWIDSICIVQDDGKDWAAEAAKMGDIYAAAWVVLAATSASDSSRGFLHQRPVVVNARPLQLGFDSPVVHARRVNSHNPFLSVDLAGYPLFQRAWCLQERELARRIIHFSRDEVYFLCQKYQHCECGIKSGEIAQDEVSMSPFRRAIKAKGEDDPNRPSFGMYWASIVENYSSLKLTQATDALPALSGLAQQMSHFRPGAYIAGLWEKDIAYLLDWQTSGYEMPREALPEPTFSWTASSCSVYFGLKSLQGTESTLCHYVSHHCTYTTANVYGHVSAASLCLRGQAVSGLDLLNATPQCFNGPESKFDHYVRLDNGQRLGASHLGADGDLVDESAPTSPDRTAMICFALYSYIEYFSKRTCVKILLLQLKADSVGQYVRIGLATDIDETWFDEHASPITVTIT